MQRFNLRPSVIVPVRTIDKWSMWNTLQVTTQIQVVQINTFWKQCLSNTNPYVSKLFFFLIIVFRHFRMKFCLKENMLKYLNFLFDFTYSGKYITNVEKGQTVLSVAARESLQKIANNKFVKSAKHLVIDCYFVENDGVVCWHSSAQRHGRYIGHDKEGLLSSSKR